MRRETPAPVGVLAVGRPPSRSIEVDRAGRRPLDGLVVDLLNSVARPALSSSSVSPAARRTLDAIRPRSTRAQPGGRDVRPAARRRPGLASRLETLRAAIGGK